MRGKLYVSVETCGDRLSEDRIACIGSILETEGGGYRSETFFSMDEKELLTDFFTTVRDYNSESPIEKVTTWSEKEGVFLRRRPMFYNGYLKECLSRKHLPDRAADNSHFTPKKHAAPNRFNDRRGNETPAYLTSDEKIGKVRSIEEILHPQGTEYAYPSREEAEYFFREHEFDPNLSKKAERSLMLLENGMHDELIGVARLNAQRLHVYEKMQEAIRADRFEEQYGNAFHERLREKMKGD